MIHINLDGVHPNNFSDSKALLIVAGKLEDLAYIDNLWEMDAGINRRNYIREKMKKISHPEKPR